MSYDKQVEKREQREKEERRDKARNEKRGIVELFLAEVKEDWEVFFLQEQVQEQQ